MENQVSTATKDEQAARLYLHYWQAGEVGKKTQTEDEVKLRAEILTLGYPDPEKICFDNEAMPCIKWQDPKFDWCSWVNNFLEDETNWY